MVYSIVTLNKTERIETEFEIVLLEGYECVPGGGHCYANDWSNCTSFNGNNYDCLTVARGMTAALREKAGGASADSFVCIPSSERPDDAACSTPK
ncbi:hypothetical protein HQ524_01110 [Candidatus Uhrbacteria bacterium]|nr:hypothetical protein [Candidatus Uhrbacteria bacterium]